MTVRELIESLSKIEDQEIRVMVKGYEGGYNDIANNTPAIYEMAIGVNEEWYYGEHEKVGDIDRDSVEKYDIVKAIVIE